MPNNSKFSSIRTKDPVINTFPWEGLKKSPEVVEQSYVDHALTHMSLGDTDDYLKTLKRNVTVNKSASIGAIIGPYGYGKTSTAIHVWRTSQEEYGMLSVPPFEWYKLIDMIEAVTGWATYKFNQGPKHLLEPLIEIYERYRDRSLEEIASQLGIEIEKAMQAYEEGTLLLGITPSDVISFLLEVTELCTKNGDYTGLVVYVDELQEAADTYSSIKDFQTDLFAFADKIPTHHAKLALILTFPDTLEANINTTRPDIIHRLKNSSLYLRVEAIYGRSFPRELWEKYAQVFEFEEDIFQPLDEITLDSIGQIAMRKDLGAGPRTVINSLVEAVKYYENMSKPYSPIDLVDGFLDNKIVFEQEGKFSKNVRKAIENRIVQSKQEYIKLIKLLAAFPLGCNRKTAELYNLEIPFDRLLESEIYGEIIFRQSEGYTLRSLLAEEVSAEPTYIRLIRDNFIRHFAPDKSHALKAMEAFKKYILKAYFEPGKANQIDKWKWKSEENEGQECKIIDLIGSFNPTYPEREVRILLGISPQSTQPIWGESDKEINFAFLLNYAEPADTSCQIKFPPDELSLKEVFLQLNLLKVPAEKPNVPRIDSLFPPDKMTALFLLALLDYLDSIDEKIPGPEKAVEVRILQERLKQYAEQSLFGDDVVIDERFDFIGAGESLIQKIFLQMCESLYPDYHTYVKSSQWEKYIQSYMKAIQDPKVTTRVARGKDVIETDKKYVANMFGETSAQRVENVISDQLADLVKIEYWGSRGVNDAKIRFNLHPLEEDILKLLENSDKFEDRPNGRVKKIDIDYVYEFSQAKGYKKTEVVEAIRILNARQLVTYKEQSRVIEQLIRSVEDLRESIVDRIENCSTEINTLEKIPEFDSSRFTRRIADIESKVNDIEDQEVAELLIQDLDGIQRGLRKYKTATYVYHQNDLKSIFDKINRLTTSGIPEELKIKVAGGEAPWSSVLEDSRQRLKRRYDELIADYKDLAKEITQQYKNEPDEKLTAEDVVGIYEYQIKIKGRLEDLDARKSGSMANQKNLGFWRTLLSKSNQLYHEAVTAQASFNDDRFIRSFTQISEEIKDEFGSSPLDALSDFKKFEEKIESVGEDIHNWQRNRRKNFIDSKNIYEKVLNTLGDDKPTLKTNFDAYMSSDENVQALIDEASEHVLNILNRINQSLEVSLNEYKFFTNIKKVDIGILQDDIVEDITKTNKYIHDIHKVMNDQDALSAMSAEVGKVQDHVISYNKEIFSSLAIKAPDSEVEENLLSVIKENLEDNVHGIELKKIIISLMEDDESVDLEEVLDHLLELFKKNQIDIRIQLRGSR